MLNKYTWELQETLVTMCNLKMYSELEAIIKVLLSPLKRSKKLQENNQHLGDILSLLILKAF